MKTKPLTKGEQYDLPVKLSLTIGLKNHHARLWNAYAISMAELDPSQGQLATAMIQRGLDCWAKEKGIE